jgi:hypothetical protein
MNLRKAARILLRRGTARLCPTSARSLRRAGRTFKASASIFKPRTATRHSKGGFCEIPHFADSARNDGRLLVFRRLQIVGAPTFPFRESCPAEVRA